MARPDDRSPVGAGYWPQLVHGGLQSRLSTDTGECLGQIACNTGAIEDAELYGPPEVKISQAWFGVPSGSLIANQTVGDYTQTATADGGPANADFAADQQVGSYTQDATATVQLDASADQQVGAYTQTATAAVFADAQAAQQVADYTQTATAENDSPAVAQVAAVATPGYVRSRYRVRVGRRWVEVDPLDPASVQAAFAAAEQAGAEAAETRVVAPRRSAARVVAARPADAPAIDYAVLAADAQRIAEQVREVYAQALQRELIARLIRAAMERDEDEAVLLLLG